MLCPWGRLLDVMAWGQRSWKTLRLECLLPTYSPEMLQARTFMAGPECSTARPDPSGYLVPFTGSESAFLTQKSKLSVFHILVFMAFYASSLVSSLLAFPTGLLHGFY